MKIFSRDILKEFFGEGKRPTQQQFEALINSSLNILDDGFSKNTKDGLKISPGQDNQTLMSFCAKLGADPSWVFTIDDNEDLLIEPKRADRQPSLLLNSRKTVITGDVEVEGIKKGKSLDPVLFLPVADGRWHDITENLYGIHSMEVTASITGEIGSGQYAILSAWTTNCFGKSRIRRIGSFYGFFGHKIRIRWRKNKDNTYRLQIKSRLRYKNGKQLPIHCDITYRYKYERKVFEKAGQG